jgi:hypothetical protein
MGNEHRPQTSHILAGGSFFSAGHLLLLQAVRHVGLDGRGETVTQISLNKISGKVTTWTSGEDDIEMDEKNIFWLTVLHNVLLC